MYNNAKLQVMPTDKYKWRQLTTTSDANWQQVMPTDNYYVRLLLNNYSTASYNYCLRMTLLPTTTAYNFVPLALATARHTQRMSTASLAIDWQLISINILLRTDNWQLHKRHMCLRLQCERASRSGRYWQLAKKTNCRQQNWTNVPFWCCDDCAAS